MGYVCRIMFIKFEKKKEHLFAFIFQLNKIIEESLSTAQKILDDVDLHLLVHNDFGKGKIKKCKVSPDAFIQMAMQLAYYRVSSNFSIFSVGTNYVPYTLLYLSKGGGYHPL